MSLFGTHVVGCAKDFTTVLLVISELCPPGQPEIDERNTVVLPEHDVTGLQVAMQDPQFVYCGDRTGDLPRIVDGFRFAHPVINTGTQISAGNVLHRNMCMIVCNTKIEDLHDVGMPQFSDYLVFVQEAIEGIGMISGAWRLPQNFQYQLLLCRFVFGEVDRREFRRAQFADQPVTSDQRMELIRS